MHMFGSGICSIVEGLWWAKDDFRTRFLSIVSVQLDFSYVNEQVFTTLWCDCHWIVSGNFAFMSQWVRLTMAPREQSTFIHSYIIFPSPQCSSDYCSRRFTQAPLPMWLIPERLASFSVLQLFLSRKSQQVVAGSCEQEGGMRLRYRELWKLVPLIGWTGFRTDMSLFSGLQHA